MHPEKIVVVSCEEQGPTMVWWSPEGALGQRQTRHQGRIHRVVFSRDGHWVASLGGNEGSMSVQLTSWRDNTELTFRTIGNETISDLQFNPYDRS